MMDRKKIVLVEYFNTEPFMAGLKTIEGKYDLVRKIPSECAAYFKERKADIALIPVASFFEIDGAHMITDYGIGCNGVVRTVVLFSNTPKNKIRKIYLDNHSRTSVQLCRIVARRFWNIEVAFVRSAVDNIELQEGEAVLMIGDKVFGNEGRFKHTFDLGAEWKAETGLPFVFAVWVSHGEVPDHEVAELNAVFDLGMQEIPHLVQELKEKKKIDLQSYFEENIVYRLGDDGRKAIALFKSLINTLK